MSGVPVTVHLRGATENCAAMRLLPQRHLKGFTLIELMIAVVVAGILAAVAYPAFTSFIARGRRADAIAMLTSIVQAQERHRSNKSSYAESFPVLNMGETVSTKYYDFSMSGISGSFVIGYQVTATPKTDGAQASDASKCATLSVKLDGGQLSYLATDSSEHDTSTTCWSR